MKYLFKNRLRSLLMGLGFLVLPTAAHACAVCYGQSDSAMAQGMNWGIMTLLAVVGCVLGGIASFFVYLGWRSSGVDAPSTGDSPADKS